MSIEEIRALLDEAHTLLARVWDSPETPAEITDRVHQALTMLEEIDTDE